MRIIFDQGTPLPLRDFLKDHHVSTAFRMGWAELKNGELIAAAEERFDLIITTDKNWKYQQQLASRRIAILVLPTTNWPELKLQVHRIIEAIQKASPGAYIEL
jgi:predicted nuclease of predicted toxin-antitoxin system